MKSLLNLFCAPNARKLAERKLQEARIHLLDMQDSAEYAAAMAGYQAGRIQRLEKHLSSATAPTKA